MAGAEPRTVWGNPRPLCPLQTLCSPGVERRAVGRVSVRAMLGTATLIARSHTTAEGSRRGTNGASGRQLGGTSPPQPARVRSPHVQPGTMAQSCQHPHACHRCTVTLLCPRWPPKSCPSRRLAGTAGSTSSLEHGKPHAAPTQEGLKRPARSRRALPTHTLRLPAADGDRETPSVAPE